MQRMHDKIGLPTGAMLAWQDQARLMQQLTILLSQRAGEVVLDLLRQQRRHGFTLDSYKGCRLLKVQEICWQGQMINLPTHENSFKRSGSFISCAVFKIKKSYAHLHCCHKRGPVLRWQQRRQPCLACGHQQAPPCHHHPRRCCPCLHRACARPQGPCWPQAPLGERQAHQLRDLQGPLHCHQECLHPNQASISGMPMSATMAPVA